MEFQNAIFNLKKVNIHTGRKKKKGVMTEKREQLKQRRRLHPLWHPALANNEGVVANSVPHSILQIPEAKKQDRSGKGLQENHSQKYGLPLQRLVFVALCLPEYEKGNREEAVKQLVSPQLGTAGPIR